MFAYILVAAIGLASLPAVIGANTFVGCQSVYQNPNQGLALPQGTTASGCAAFCARNAVKQTQPAFMYSYFIPGGDPMYGNTCYCGPTPPPAANIRQSTVADPTDCVDSSAYSTFRIDTTFAFDICVPAVTNALRTTTQDTTDACFDNCKDSTRATLSIATTDNTKYTCQCGGEVDGQLPIQCGSTARFSYSHPAYAAASQLRRRADRVGFRAVKRQQDEFCPAGLVACKIPGSTSYECIDTASELESCGGCIHGVFGSNITTAERTGSDCSALPGAPLGSFSCIDSQCVTSRCDERFALIGGLCLEME